MFAIFFILGSFLDRVVTGEEKWIFYKEKKTLGKCEGV
jgi:hypothetical protein